LYIFDILNFGCRIELKKKEEKNAKSLPYRMLKTAYCVRI